MEAACMIDIGADVDRTTVQVKQRLIRMDLCRDPPPVDAFFLTNRGIN
jgi:hypothetical protein